MRAFLTSLTLAALLTSRAALAAEDGCQYPKTSYDRTYCVAKLFLESDNELNAVYKELKKSLGNEAQRRLTVVQREWIKYRDSTCEAGGTINVSCNYDANRARAEFLRDRLRECKTGHCREDLVGQKSW